MRAKVFGLFASILLLLLAFSSCGKRSNSSLTSQLSSPSHNISAFRLADIEEGNVNLPRGGYTLSVEPRGDSLLVRVEISGASAWKEAQFKIEYPDSAYHPVRVETGEFAGQRGGVLLFSLLNQKGFIPVGIAKIRPDINGTLSGSGTLVEVTFEKGADSDVKLVSSVPSDVANRVIINCLLSVEGVECLFKEINLGDYNNDGSVGAADVSPLAFNFGASLSDSDPNNDALVQEFGGADQIINASDITNIAFNFSNRIEGYTLKRGDAPETLADYIELNRADIPADQKGPTTLIHPTYLYVDSDPNAPSSWYQAIPFAVEGPNKIPGIESLITSLSGTIDPGAPAPVISSIMPGDVYEGDNLRVLGSNFGSARGQVFFNALEGTNIQSWADNQIRITVPTGVTAGTLKVTAANGKSSNLFNYSIATPPVITSINPQDNLLWGAVIDINGMNFGTTKGQSFVQFAAQVATQIAQWTDTKIRVAVPNGVPPGNVVLGVKGRLSNAVAYTTFAYPWIDSINPVQAKPGDPVTVSGSNFADPVTSELWFGTNKVASGNIVSWSSTQIVATVPNIAAGTYDVTVKVSGNAGNTMPFTVVPDNPPAITNITPVKGQRGDTLTINGDYFGPDQAQGKIWFGANAAPASDIVSWNNTQIKVKISSNCPLGKVQVKVEYNTLQSSGYEIKCIKVGDAPDFTLPNWNSVMTSLSDYSGDVRLLNFWAYWCPPCRAEMPILTQFQQDYGAQGFSVLAIHMDPDTQAGKDLVTQEGWNVREWLFDEDAAIYSLYQQFVDNPGYIPVSILVAKDGNLARYQGKIVHWVGSIESREAEVRARIEEELAKPAP